MWKSLGMKVLVCVSLNLSFLEFVDFIQYGNFSNQIWKAFANHVFKYPFGPLYTSFSFWDSNYVYVLCLMVSCRFLRTCSFFLLFFLLVLLNFCWLIFKLNDSLFFLLRMLTFSREFYISAFMFYDSGILIWLKKK